MPISEATVQEFQAAWQAAQGVQLGPKEAREALEGLVRHFDLLAQIDAGYEEP